MGEDERDVFQKLSVFRGGFTREAAQVVAGASLQMLARLIDQSLVRLNAAGRYDVHELLRQLEHNIKTQQQITALDTIAADFENMRYAWQLAIQQRHFEALSQAVESLHLFADMRVR